MRTGEQPCKTAPYQRRIATQGTNDQNTRIVTSSFNLFWTDCKESLDDVEAYLAIDWSCTNELFGTPEIQDASEPGDATDTHGDALETPSTEDLDQDPEPEVSVSDEDGGECVAPESDGEIVDETLHQSPMKKRTRSKSRKLVVPEPLIQ